MKVVEGGSFFRFSPTGNDDVGLYGPGVVEKPEEMANIAQTRRLSEIACHSTRFQPRLSRPPKVVEGGSFFRLSPTGNGDVGLYGTGVVENAEEVVNIA